MLETSLMSFLTFHEVSLGQSFTASSSCFGRIKTGTFGSRANAKLSTVILLPTPCFEGVDPLQKANCNGLNTVGTFPF